MAKATPHLVCPIMNINADITTDTAIPSQFLTSKCVCVEPFILYTSLNCWYREGKGFNKPFPLNQQLHIERVFGALELTRKSADFNSCHVALSLRSGRKTHVKRKTALHLFSQMASPLRLTKH